MNTPKDPTYTPRLNHLIISTPTSPPGLHDSIVAFYVAALKPLGYEVLHRYGPVVGMSGDGGKHADFWITPARDREGFEGAGEDVGGKKELVSRGIHLAFTADDHKQVDAFHAAAIEAGGKDFGKPGVRTHYHRDYYAAFVLDPLGNNIEAVDHKAYPGGGN